MAVFLSPVGGVAAQFFTNNGVPLAGGKLYSYAAGTTTPQVTYTSSSGGTLNTNPIILDSGGRVASSGEIWLTDNTVYKFVLKDSSDVLIATWDNINGINSNFSNFISNQEIQTATAGQTVFTLANPYVPGANTLSVFVDGVNQYGPGATYAYVETGANTVTFVSGLHVGASVKFTTVQSLTSTQSTTAALVTYTPAGAGAVATTVQTKLREYISVKDFGAVGNGTTDDTAAIQAALNFAQNGQSVYFPTGYYLFSSVSKIGTVRLVGDGFTNALQAPFGDSEWSNKGNFSGSVLISTATSGTAISMGDAVDTAGPLWIFQMQDLMIVGPGTGASTAIKFTRGVGHYVQNVLMANFKVGLDLESCQDGTYNKIAAKGCDTGVYLSGSITSNQSVFYNPEIQSYAQYGMRIVSAALVSVFGGLFQDAKGSGIGIKTEASSGSNNVFKAVWFESTVGTYAIYDLGLYNTYENCYFSRPTDQVYFGATAYACTLKDSRFAPGINSAVYIAASASQITISNVFIPGTTPIYDGGTNTVVINSPSASYAGQFAVPIGTINVAAPVESVASVNSKRNANGTSYYSELTTANDVSLFGKYKNTTGTAYYGLFYYNGTEKGSITSSGSGVTYNTVSDYRLKNVDGPITDSGTYIDSLNPVQGTFKENNAPFIGFIAHEVKAVSKTDIVNGEKDGEQLQSMDYSSPEIIANLVAELQSLRKRVAKLNG